MDKVTLSLSINEINVVLSALGKAPYEAVFQLVEEINRQVVPQLQNVQQAPSEDN